MAKIDRLTKIAALTAALATDDHLDGYSVEEVRDALSSIDGGHNVGTFLYILQQQGFLKPVQVANDPNGDFGCAVRKSLWDIGEAHRSNPAAASTPHPLSRVLNGPLPPLRSVMGQIAVDRENGVSPYDLDLPSKP